VTDVALTLKLTLQGERYWLYATDGKDEWKGETDSELRGVHTEHYALLEAVKQDLRLYRHDPQANAQCLPQAMDRLRKRSDTLLELLTPWTERADFRSLCRNALAPARDAGEVPRIEVSTTSRLPFPFELLAPFAIDEWPAKIDDEASLHAACRCFLGYFAAVRRTLIDQPEIPQATTLGDSGPLRVTYLHFAGLQGAQDEWDFLSTQPRIKTDEPWPPVGMVVAQGGGPLARQVFDPSLDLHGNRDEPVQIQHFACHCLTDGDDENDHQLILGSEATPAHILLRHLRRAMQDEGNAALVKPPRPGPLVFLNACGTSVVRPDALTFPMFFLENRNLGFIGAEVAVPDQTAADFSIAFYESLLGRGPRGRRTAGEALVDAKQKLVWESTNPLGLLWTMYADPDLELPEERAA
jgi:hypothetical protein